MTGDALFFILYATAQLIPSAVPAAARIADARFHKNLINLDLFSWFMFYPQINLLEVGIIAASSARAASALVSA